jgi:Protein of unknown function (DUF2905)
MDGMQGGGGGLGWGLVIIGLLIAGVGLIWVIAPNALRLGRLPGDIVIRGRNGAFYFPAMTCVVVSIVLSLAIWAFRALTR